GCTGACTAGCGTWERRSWPSDGEGEALGRAAHRNDRREVLGDRRPRGSAVGGPEDLARLGAEVQPERILPVVAEGLPQDREVGLVLRKPAIEGVPGGAS